MKRCESLICPCSALKSIARLSSSTIPNYFGDGKHAVEELLKERNQQKRKLELEKFYWDNWLALFEIL